MAIKELAASENDVWRQKMTYGVRKWCMASANDVTRQKMTYSVRNYVW